MTMHLKQRIEKHLKRSASAPTRFSRDASGDPRLVFDIRNGREVGPKLAARINAYLEVHGQ
jgi:hypothetical protein